MNLEVNPPTNNSKGLTQSYVLRKVAYDIVVQLATKAVSDEDLETSRVIAQAIRSWADVDDRVRIKNGTPLPGSLRPQAKEPKRERGKGAEAVAKETAKTEVKTAAPVVMPAPVDPPAEAKSQ